MGSRLHADHPANGVFIPRRNTVGDPLLAQHLHSLVMLQRLALANGYGWQRFLNSVNQVLPKRGATLEVPVEMRELQAAE